jgi:uncharacterized lipoprotein YmbA
MNADPRRAAHRRLLASLPLLLSLAGCFSLARQEPPQRHYVLGDGAPVAESRSAAAREGPTVGLRRLRLATYLEMPYVVVREGASEVAYSEYHRWGEPLGEGINRAVAGRLAARGGFRGVDTAPFPAQQRYDYLVQLHVERFEGVAPTGAVTGSAQGEAQLLATWEVIRQADGVVVARGATDHRAPGWRVGDYPDLVRLLGAGLDVLTADVARSIGA